MSNKLEKLFLSLFITVSLVFSCTFVSAQQADTVFVVSLAGQSNMGGVGNYEVLDQDVKSRIDKVAHRVKLSIGGSEPRPLSYTYSKHNKRKRGFGKTFGPELFIGLSLAESYPNKEFLLVKTAFGGTSLYGAWNPRWDPQKADSAETRERTKEIQLYRQHKNNFLANIERLEKKGIPYKIIGMAWMQGEKDTRKEFSARAYEENLATLIKSYRTDFNAPEMPFVLGQINNPAPAGYTGIVRNAMVKVAQQDSLTGLIPTSTDTSWSDYPKLPDDVHYNAEGQKRLGMAMARKLINLTNN